MIEWAMSSGMRSARVAAVSGFSTMRPDQRERDIGGGDFLVGENGGFDAFRLA